MQNPAAYRSETPFVFGRATTLNMSVRDMANQAIFSSPEITSLGRPDALLYLHWFSATLGAVKECPGPCP